MKKTLYVAAIVIAILVANNIFGLNPFGKLPIEDIASSSIFLNASLNYNNGGGKIVKIGDKEIELKLDFKAGEDPYFIVDINGYSRIEDKLSLITNQTKTTSEEMDFDEPNSLYHNLISNIAYTKAVYASDSSVSGVSVKLTNPAGEEAEISPEMEIVDNDKLAIRIPRGAGSFKPGVWKLSVEIEAKKKILRAEQDFSWGVLAINTNKAVYELHEKRETEHEKRESAYLQMAVLDDKGETICDSNLELVVTSPSGNKTILRTVEGERGLYADSNADKTRSTQEAGMVYRSGKCGRNNVTDVPDYFAYYNVEEVGEYKMELTVLTPGPSPAPQSSVERGGISSHTITDTFEAVEAGSLPFEIERTGPTRIYPAAEYEMKIRVKANEDFEGDIVERVPNGFTLIGNGFSRITDDADTLSKIKETPNKGISFEPLETRSIYIGSPPICYNNCILNKNICQEDKFCNKKAPVDPAGLAPATEGDDPSVLLHNTTGPKTPGLNTLYHNIKEFLSFGFVDKEAYAAEKGNNGYQEIVLAEDVSLKAGDVIELTYTFDAPDITPELFLLGPVSFIGRDEALPRLYNGDNIYIEPRLWQIASDGLNKSYVQAANTNGLVGMWELDSASYNQTTDTIYGKYGSDLLTAVSDPALTTGFDGRANTAISFDGSADYLKQKVYAQKVGTVTMATVATGALFNDNGGGVDFSPYVGASGQSKPYMIVVTDTGVPAKTAWGYIGEEGTGETYIDKIGGTDPGLNNGDFEDWTDNNPDNWLIYGTENAANYFTQNPAGQCQYVSDGTTFYLYQTTLTINKLYKYSIDIKNVTGGGIRIQTGVTTIVIYSTSGIKTGYFTATNGEFQIKRDGASNVTFDDVSIKEVTALPANTGVKIYSTKTGSTQSWAGVEDGFLPNSIASYEVRKTDFQITGALTMGAWVKPNVVDEGGHIISKFKNVDYGFGLIWWGPDNKLYFYYDGINQGKSSSAVFTESNEWVFVTVTKNASGNVAFYKNGVVAGTATGATVSDSPYDLRIGNRTGGTTIDQHFNGSIARPFVYDRALSGTEISSLYNSQKSNFIQAQNNTGLAGYWELDSASYNQTTDAIYGKYGSDLLTAVSDPALADGFDGRANTAISFDGSADYLKQKVWDMQQGVLSYQGNDTTTAEFRDTTQNFADWQTASGNAAYMIVVTNSDTTVSWGYLGTANNGLGTNDDIDIYTTKALATRGWNGTFPVAGGKTPSSYEVRKTDFQVSDAFSIGAWVKTSSNTLQSIITKYYNITQDTWKGFAIYLRTSNPYVRVKICDGTDALYVTDNSLATDPKDGNWHFIVSTFDNSTDTAKIYIDGVDSNCSWTGSNIDAIDSYHSFEVGRNIGYSSYFSGSIARPFVYDRALSGTEVLSLYKAQKKFFIE